MFSIYCRSHSVHHANTNHISDGETHVPVSIDSKWPSGKKIISKIFGRTIGGAIFGFAELLKHLLFGWPAYILTGSYVNEF